MAGRKLRKAADDTGRRRGGDGGGSIPDRSLAPNNCWAKSAPCIIAQPVLDCSNYARTVSANGGQQADVDIMDAEQGSSFLIAPQLQQQI